MTNPLMNRVMREKRANPEAAPAKSTAALSSMSAMANMRKGAFFKVMDSPFKLNLIK